MRFWAASHSDAERIGTLCAKTPPVSLTTYTDRPAGGPCPCGKQVYFYWWTERDPAAYAIWRAWKYPDGWHPGVDPLVLADDFPENSP